MQALKYLPYKPLIEILIFTSVVVPCVTCELPLRPIHLDSNWNHLSNLTLANPGFGQPGRIDTQLGVDVFVEVMLHGQRTGPPGSPTAFETTFGWVLAGGVDPHAMIARIASHHSFVTSEDDFLYRFWEIEEKLMTEPALLPEERFVLPIQPHSHR